MNWQWTPFTIFLSAVALASFWSAGYVWFRYRHKSTARMGVMLIFAVGWWMMGSVFELSSIEPASRFFWDKLQFIAIVALPPGWVTYTMRYVGLAGKLTRRRFVLLWLIPSLTIVLVYTNGYHHLFWTSYTVTAVEGVLVKSAQHGPAFWLFMAHAYAAVFTGMAILLRAAAGFGRLYRWQVIALIVVAIVPWLINSASIFLDWRPLWGVDLTPFALGITASIAGWTVYRLQVRDIGPAARHMVIEQMGDAVLVLDSTHGILDLNPAMQNLLQRPKSQLLTRSITQMWPEWPQALLLPDQKTDVQIEWVLGQSSPRTFDMRVTPLLDGRDQLVSRIVVLRDMGERKQMEEHLKASLREKDVLLKEIHHRVKNNLQIISSLLNLQASQAAEPLVLQALQEGQGRVRSMALIHEILYRSHDLAHIDFGLYIRELTTQLWQTYRVHAEQIDLDIQTDTVFLTMETAVPCGLILHELVSNALKHGFVDGRSGQITIRLQAKNCPVYELNISDNGAGFPPHLDHRQTTTLGLQLVNTLIDQLGGHLVVTHQQGTSFTITFEDKTPKETS